MKIEAVAAPAAPEAPQAPMSARERAIARLTAQAAPAAEAPVPNPTSVSPEEMGAIKSQAPVKTEEAPAAPTPEDKSEASQPSEATDKEEKQPLSAQYAQLARKEKAIRALEAQAKAKEADLVAREAAIQAKLAETTSNSISKQKLLEDPLGTLTELGLTYDQLTQKALNAPSAEESAMLAQIKKLEAKLEALEGETKGTKQTIEDRDRQAYQGAINAIRTEVQTLVTAGDDFEAIRETDSVGDVVELIERTFKEDGRLMTVQEAAQLVEDELQSHIMRLANLKKIQSKLKPAEAPKPAAPKQEASVPEKKITTLTNAMGSQPRMNARERAILAMQGKLAK